MAVWTHPAERLARIGAAPDLARHAARLRATWERYRLYRRTLRELRQLDDRDLIDIGIHPADVERIARERDVDLRSLDLAGLDEIWERAKEFERTRTAGGTGA